MQYPCDSLLLPATLYLLMICLLHVDGILPDNEDNSPQHSTFLRTLRTTNGIPPLYFAPSTCSQRIFQFTEGILHKNGIFQFQLL